MIYALCLSLATPTALPSQLIDINCNYTPSNPSNHWTVGGGSVSTINTITFSPDPYCAKLVVTKNANNTTLVQAYGYNTCDTTNPRRVERAVQATY